MVSSKPIALMMMIATLVAVSVDAEGFFSRRRNQKHQQNYQRPLNSNFRQRLGTQVNCRQAESYNGVNNVISFITREMVVIATWLVLVISSNPNSRAATATALHHLTLPPPLQFTVFSWLLESYRPSMRINWQDRWLSRGSCQHLSSKLRPWRKQRRSYQSALGISSSPGSVGSVGCRRGRCQQSGIIDHRRLGS